MKAMVLRDSARVSWNGPAALKLFILKSPFPKTMR